MPTRNQTKGNFFVSRLQNDWSNLTDYSKWRVKLKQSLRMWRNDVACPPSSLLPWLRGRQAWSREVYYDASSTHPAVLVPSWTQPEQLFRDNRFYDGGSDHPSRTRLLFRCFMCHFTLLWHKMQRSTDKNCKLYKVVSQYLPAACIDYKKRLNFNLILRKGI